MKTKVEKQIDRWTKEDYLMREGEEYVDISFAVARRRFYRFFKLVERLKFAIENPLAPGSAEILDEGITAFGDMCDWDCPLACAAKGIIRRRADR